MLELTSELCKDLSFGECFQVIQKTFSDLYVLGPVLLFFGIILLWLFINGLSRGYSRKRLIATKGYGRAFWITLFLGIILFILFFII